MSVDNVSYIIDNLKRLFKIPSNSTLMYLYLPSLHSFRCRRKFLYRRSFHLDRKLQFPHCHRVHPILWHQCCLLNHVTHLFRSDHRDQHSRSNRNLLGDHLFLCCKRVIGQISVANKTHHLIKRIT